MKNITHPQLGSDISRADLVAKTVTTQNHVFFLYDHYGSRGFESLVSRKLCPHVRSQFFNFYHIFDSNTTQILLNENNGFLCSISFFRSGFPSFRGMQLQLYVLNVTTIKKNTVCATSKKFSRIETSSRSLRGRIQSV